VLRLCLLPEIALSRVRHVPKTIADIPGTAFTTAEEAWFWFVRCHQVRREGAQLADSKRQFARPCDPDDVYRAVMGLARRGILAGTHLKALAKFGLAGRPPDARCRDETDDARLWDEALDRLSTILRVKGIVA
jgi:hypothetical protein